MEEELKTIIKPIVEKEGFQLEKVELGEREGERSVTVTISGDSLGVNDCAQVSKAIDDKVEEQDPFGGESYLLVVTSPGS